ncbi:hypothetical protein [Conyzicola lurida]|uniref:hypothetical protein n=1 Tax=Conyzicola lurida TaxID=1172621 RepID=UPI001612DD6F|nr:hypothetical protein [Conyzicola lurida]
MTNTVPRTYSARQDESRRSRAQQDGSPDREPRILSSAGNAARTRSQLSAVELWQTRQRLP